jgi:hypothetical protein
MDIEFGLHIALFHGHYEKNCSWGLEVMEFGTQDGGLGADKKA